MKTLILQEKTDALRERSGNVISSDSLVMFIYRLARDHLPVGAVEQILGEIELADWAEEARFTNGWLATWAIDAALRLLT